MVRPEYLRLHPLDNARHDDWYPGRVEEVHYLGHTRIFRIWLDVGASIEALTLSGDGRGLVADSRVFVEIPPEAFHIICTSGVGELRPRTLPPQLGTSSRPWRARRRHERPAATQV